MTIKQFGKIVAALAAAGDKDPVKSAHVTVDGTPITDEEGNEISVQDIQLILAEAEGEEEEAPAEEAPAPKKKAAKKKAAPKVEDAPADETSE